MDINQKRYSSHIGFSQTTVLSSDIKAMAPTSLLKFPSCAHYAVAYTPVSGSVTFSPDQTGSPVLRVFVELFRTFPYFGPHVVLGKQKGAVDDADGKLPSFKRTACWCTYIHARWCEAERAAPLTGSVGGSSRKPAQHVTFSSKTDHIRTDVRTSIRK